MEEEEGEDKLEVGKEGFRVNEDMVQLRCREKRLKESI